MKKREFIKSGLLASGGFGLLGATSLLSTVSAHANVSPSLAPEDIIPENFTVPSWTRYKRAVANGLGQSLAETLLVPKERPFNIGATVNGDPSTRMGITWYTNAGQTGQYIQYFAGELSDDDGFCNAIRKNADSEVSLNDYIYNNSQNLEVSGKYSGSFGGPYTHDNDAAYPPAFVGEGENGSGLYATRSYVSHKVLLKNLQPDTLYTYRVGREGHFRIGTFKTAKASTDKAPFKFLYIADTQAHNEDYFDASTRTVTTAYRNAVNKEGGAPLFLLCAGDHVESNLGDVLDPANFTLTSTYYVKNSEWEWEQWFERMQDTWLKLPVVPVQGNHDTAYGFNNMFHHFNTDKSYNASAPEGAKTDMDGTVYSFVCGDALFMVINFEDALQKDENGTVTPLAARDAYFAGLQAWMKQQISIHSDVKWRIVTYHKTIFTGSSSHQDDADSKIVREKMAPFFEEAGIDLALQGHDHIYEAIGVISTQETTYSLVADAVTNQEIKEVVVDNSSGKHVTDSMTGKHGGTFNVNRGMVYFLNNSAGKKKYYPRTKEEMEAKESVHGIPAYFEKFNKFGQQNKPTFSEITVSTDEIKIETYEVEQTTGNAAIFDTIRIVRTSDDKRPTNIEEIGSRNALRITATGNRQVRIEAPEAITDVRMYSFTGAQVISGRSNVLNLSGVAAGIYLLNVQTVSGVYTERFIVKP
jgi:hypothetical protein